MGVENAKDEMIKSKKFKNRRKFGDKIVPETFEDHVKKTLKEIKIIQTKPNLRQKEKNKSNKKSKSKSVRGRGARILEEKRKSGYLPTGPRDEQITKKNQQNFSLPIKAARKGEQSNSALYPPPPPAPGSFLPDDELPFYSLGGYSDPLAEYRPPPDALAALRDYSTINYENYVQIDKEKI